MVLSCALISVWAGSISYGITAFVNPLVAEFGWTYLAVSLAVSLRNVEMGLLAPVAGFLSDRFGPRKVAFLGGLMCGIGFLMLSRTNSLALLYIAFIVLSVGYTGLGQSVTTTVVANWFKKKIGVATGFAVAGFGAGGILLPFMAWLIVEHGWRLCSVVLGLGTWILVLPLSLVLRHKPEKYGYWPDGEMPSFSTVDRNGIKTIHSREVDLTMARTIRTRVFWFMAFVFAVQFMVVQAVTLHIMPYGAAMNLSETTSAMVAMFIPVSSVAGRLLGGWLRDTLGSRHVLAATFLLQSLGLVFLYYGHDLWQFIAFLVFFGPAFGGANVLRSTMIREYFGRIAFGSIHGLIMAIMTLGGFIGPALAGWIFDVRGSYQVAWLIFAVTLLPAGLMVYAIRKESNDEK